MARITKPLSALQIKNATPKDKIYKLFDGSGLYLEISPRGTKLWRMKIRHNGKENLLSFGKYPIVSLDQARKFRDDAKKLLAEGINPAEAKKTKKQEAIAKTEHTFEKLARQWHQNRLAGWQENTAKDIINRMEKDVFPEIGNMQIDQITSKQVVELLKKVENRGALEIAKRLKANIARVFRYAMQLDLCERNVAADLQDVLKPVAKKHFNSIASSELPEFLKRLDANVTRSFPETRIATYLMLYLFLRISELTEAEWSEIDLDNGVWIIPWTRMKMGRKKINPVMVDHRIDLPNQVIALLKELYPITGYSKYLFPSRSNPKKTMSKETVNRVLQKMGYKGQMSSHGFRSLAASTLEEIGYRREVIDRQLAHMEKNKIQKAYFRATFQEERKELLQAWANYIDKVRKGTVVIPFQFKVA